MKGDFTRDTFDAVKHFSRVLMQQGRVALDADHNEQTAILLRYMRMLARDIIGPYAAPAGADGGFLLAMDANNDFTISKGRYYVDGILVENDTDNCTYKHQPDFPVPADDALSVALAEKAKANHSFLIYLDVWERHITPIEDDSIREKALGGPDTCTRAKVVWQVKARRTKLATRGPDQKTQLENHLSKLVRISSAWLAARVDPGVQTKDPCVVPSSAGFTGLENHLYRVEIHRGGAAGEATFKWSRDNGSVATAWLDVNGNDLQVTSTRGFTPRNWVELSDDHSDLLGKPGTLMQLVKVEGDSLSVESAKTLPTIGNFPANSKVRRWDHIATDTISLADDNALPIQESPTTAGQVVWIDLEDGVQIQFSAGGEYRTGDYWLIPARAITRDIEWPHDGQSNPRQLPPHGIEHHYALLGFVGPGQKLESIRCEFSPVMRLKKK